VKKCECCFEEKVAGLAGSGIKRITTKIYMPAIYIVNSSL
jgi:hypothetical protein